MEKVGSWADNLWTGYSGLPQETQLFIAAILLLTIWFHLFFTQKAVNYGPTILTTSGIFATFVAIAIGLTAFDDSNIQKSVPALLAALKTAFWASVVGVGGALTLKFRDYFLGSRGHDGDTSHPDDVTVADLARHLKDIQRALAGGEEGSLISQIKLSRQDTNDRLDSLRAAQIEALEKLSEMSSKTLVEALRDVIRDFNQKITEQFGDNFKELNAAVGQLLVWQEHYKEILETTVTKLNDVTQLTSKATDDYAELVQRAGAFSKVAEDLSQLLTTLEAEKQQLKDVSLGLAKLLQEASGSLPAVEKKVVELTTQLANAVTKNQETVGAALNASVQLMTKGITDNQKVVGEALTENARQTTELVGKTKEQVAILDAALSEELKKSLESLGRQLAALSQRFVSDYGPLTDKLRHVVELGGVGR